ncbi:hypothetical protein [Wolbachia endosymbiont of Trichogramma kaykai]|uniref:hypothetical protein n=1 Tax=Wolbachia endosymbiont of Trichogramma kaykai TaxID=444066 RepID=UPI00389266BD
MYLDTNGCNTNWFSVPHARDNSIPIVGRVIFPVTSFMELLGPGFIAAIGATLSTALGRRMFAPISTNLENATTEQQNIQGQSI